MAVDDIITAKNCKVHMIDFNGDDSDEDVILPNSPLYDYFKEYQNEDTQICEFDIKESSEKKLPNLSSIISSFTNTIYSMISTLKINCTSAWKYIFRPESNMNENSLSFKIFQSVMSTKLLISEDKTFLESYKSDFCVQYTKSIFRSFGLPSFGLLLGIVSCFTYSFLEIASTNSPYVIISILLAMSTIAMLGLNFVFIGSYVYQFAYNIAENNRCNFVLKRIKVICDDLTNIISVLKKSHKLLQESELIARGFTSASIMSIAQRLELSRGLPIQCPVRQHPELRKHLFMCTKELFMGYRKNTEYFLQKIKVKPQYSFSSHCLASLDLTEFGDCFNLDLSSDDDMAKILEISDNFSISFLKTVHQLMVLQISEFFKCLCLSLNVTLRDQDNLHFSEVLCLLKLTISEMSLDGSKIEHNLRDVYHYYRSLEASYNAENNVLSKELKSSTLEIMVHHMSLHLKSALARLLEVENYLTEINFSSREKCEPTLAKYVSKQLLGVQSEIKAYSDCYIDCSQELLLLESGNECEDKKAICQSEKSMNENDTNFHVHKKLIECNVEPIIKDEVFEALITHSMHEKNNFRQGASEVGESLKTNSKAAAYMMKELKNILVARADEYRIREERALALKMQESHLDTEISTDFLVEKSITPISLSTGAISDSALCDVSELSKEQNLNIESKKEMLNSASSDFSDLENINSLNTDAKYDSVLRDVSEELSNEQNLKRDMLNSASSDFSDLEDAEQDVAAGETLLKFPETLDKINTNVVPHLSSIDNVTESTSTQIPSKFFLDKSNQNFSASIAALASQRKLDLGNCLEECFGDDSETDDESDFKG